MTEPPTMVGGFQFRSSTQQMYVKFCPKDSGCNTGLNLVQAVLNLDFLNEVASPS